MSAKKELPSLRILIVEDNVDIAENIADYLEVQGHVLDFAMDGIGGLHLALTQDYDAIVLDIMLPGMDGLTFCRKLREQGGKQTPILMLTARDTLSDKLEGFEAGADDYLVKPFELQELEARLGALVRRAGQCLQDCLQVGDLEMDMGKMVVQRAGYPVELNRACHENSYHADAGLSQRRIAQRDRACVMGRYASRQRCIAQPHLCPASSR